MHSNDETFLCRYQYDPLDRLAGCDPSEQDKTRRFYLKIAWLPKFRAQSCARSCSTMIKCWLSNSAKTA